MSVILTEKAAKEVKRIIEDQKFEEGTCSAWVWPAAVAVASATHWGSIRTTTKRPTRSMNSTAFPLVVDKKSALYLDGTTVDFYDGLERRGFTFDNPNAVKTCGCGSSFQA